MTKDKGQIVLLLIIVVTVALAIGLSIVQKGLTDVSTASKVEQSSRAFSAAEAGIEKALKGDVALQDFTENSSRITNISDSGLFPSVPAFGTRQTALEFPPLSKAEVTQVWLADLNSVTNPPTVFYNPPTHDLDVYWGNSTTDRAALELTLIYYDGTKYTSRKWYLDQITRTPANGFELVSSCTGGYIPPLGGSTYQCKRTLGAVPDAPLPSSPSSLMLIRARLLYNDNSQPLAVQAVGTCATACSLPPQARLIKSTGISGLTQRKIQVFQVYKVLPSIFDYAIFSVGEIQK